MIRGCSKRQPGPGASGAINGKHWAAARATRGDAADWSRARRPNDRTKRFKVDVPAWIMDGLDKQARHLGVTRQSLIKLWIAERLQS